MNEHLIMARPLPEIDRLIEEGLTLYGQGDLNGALLLWEEALEIDPENPQANSYVDYVRMNYELLTLEVADDVTYAPFGIIDEDPEYQVEVSSGRDVGEALTVSSNVEEGWYFENEPREPSRREALAIEAEPTIERLPGGANGASSTNGAGLIEIEADEPPPVAAAVPVAASPEAEISFDDLTREYPGGTRPPGEKVKEPKTERERAPSRPGFAEFPLEMTPTPGFDVADTVTPGFDSVSSGFGTQVTDIRRRDLGFVQPTKPPLLVQDLPLPPGPPDDESPELKMTLRTPSLDAFDREGELEGGDDAPGWEAPPPPSAEIELTYETDDVSPSRPADGGPSSSQRFGAVTDGSTGPSSSQRFGAAADAKPAPSSQPGIGVLPRSTDATGEPSAADLIDSLPSPTPAPNIAGIHTPRVSAAMAAVAPPTRTTGVQPAVAPPARTTGVQPAVAPPARTTGVQPAVAPPARTTGVQAALQLADEAPPLTPTTTRDLPAPTRKPAPPTGELFTPGAALTATQDFDAKTAKLPPSQQLGSSADGSSGPSPKQPGERIPPGPTPLLLPQARFVEANSDAGTSKMPHLPANARFGAPTAGPSPIDPLISAPTRDLGLRTQTRPGTEDEPTHESDARLIRQLNAAKAVAAAAATEASASNSSSSTTIDARSARILAELDEQAPTGEAREDRTRRRITTLFERAVEWSKTELDRAVAAVELALSEDPQSALAQKLIHRNRDTMQTVFQMFLGDLERTPMLARPLHELAQAPISPRAAFLLSRVDGTLSLDEILDVSGMPRLEAYRYLCQLFLRVILR